MARLWATILYKCKGCPLENQSSLLQFLIQNRAKIKYYPFTLTREKDSMRARGRARAQSTTAPAPVTRSRGWLAVAVAARSIRSRAARNGSASINAPHSTRCFGNRISSTPEIAHHQGALFLSEGLRAGVADVNRGRANVSKPTRSRTQAKIGVLEIAGTEVLRKRTDLVKAGAGCVKTKAYPAWNIDSFARIDFCSNFIDPLNVFARTECIRTIRLRNS